MTRVLYDHQMFSLQKYGGISRYFANLYYSFNKGFDVNATLSVLQSNNYYIKDYSFPLSRLSTKLLPANNRKWYKYNKWYSQYIINKGQFDIFHPTYYDTYFLSKLKKPFVLTVHDMIYELFPEYFNPEDKNISFKNELIKKADHIIAISASTKNDIHRLFNIPDNKVTLVHHGFCSVKSNGESDFTPPVTQYIFFVGDRNTYKNFYRFVKAVMPLLQQNKLLHLVCAGGGSFLPEERELFNQCAIAQQVLQVTASDNSLNGLYSNALVFVFPSLYEGFGFPVLEAFDGGCPVAVSNTSCFKEVGGDAAMYFDPYNIDEITHTVSAIIANRQLAASLVEKGKKQLEKFTMEACVQKTQQVYEKLI